MSSREGERYRPDDEKLFGRLRKTLVQLRFNTLVVAEPPIGSEIADTFATRLKDEGQRVRRIDASETTSAFQLLALAGEPESTDVTTDDWLGLIGRLANTSHQHDQPEFVVVDRIPSPDIGYSLFGDRRNDLWEIHYRWAAFIPFSELDRYTVHPAETFFPTVTRIDNRQR